MHTMHVCAYFLIPIWNMKYLAIQSKIKIKVELLFHRSYFAILIVILRFKIKHINTYEITYQNSSVVERALTYFSDL